MNDEEFLRICVLSGLAFVTACLWSFVTASIYGTYIDERILIEKARKMRHKKKDKYFWAVAWHRALSFLMGPFVGFLLEREAKQALQYLQDRRKQDNEPHDISLQEFAGMVLGYDEGKAVSFAEVFSNDQINPATLVWKSGTAPITVEFMAACILLSSLHDAGYSVVRKSI